jgi:uncharacterized protein (UPF0333 family)
MLYIGVFVAFLCASYVTIISMSEERKMRVRLVSILAAMALVFTLAATASANLTNLTLLGTGTIVGGDGNEYRLIYDAAQDITWLDYTKSFANWDTQKSWAAALEVNFSGSILSGWRLPSAGDNPQKGYGMTSSEMGHLYYESLGNGGDGLQETGDFENLVKNGYWSGTEYSPDLGYAWFFSFSNFKKGYQSNRYKRYDSRALAVLPGNPAAAVPLPGAVWLLGSGLAGLLGLRRKFSRS